MQKVIFLLLKKFKNTSSARLWSGVDQHTVHTVGAWKKNLPIVQFGQFCKNNNGQKEASCNEKHAPVFQCRFRHPFQRLFKIIMQPCFGNREKMKWKNETFCSKKKKDQLSTIVTVLCSVEPIQSKQEIEKFKVL